MLHNNLFETREECICVGWCRVQPFCVILRKKNWSKLDNCDKAINVLTVLYKHGMNNDLMVVFDCAFRVLGPSQFVSVKKI